MESLWLRGRALERGNPKVRGSIPHRDSEFLVTRRKNVAHYIIITLPDKISWYTSPEQRLWSSFTLSHLQMLLVANVSMPSSRTNSLLFLSYDEVKAAPPISTVVRAEVVCSPKFLPISIFLSHTLRSKITAPWNMSQHQNSLRISLETSVSYPYFQVRFFLVMLLTSKLDTAAEETWLRFQFSLYRE